MKERDSGGSSSQWRPNIVLEGRVRRRYGSFLPGNGGGSRYFEMYVHDAVVNGTGRHLQPVVAHTPFGYVHLPATAGIMDRDRIVALYGDYFRYMRHHNHWVRQCINTAEELLQLSASERPHYVLHIAGRRPQQDLRSDRREADQQPAVGLSPFAVAAAGSHACMRGDAEVSLLTDHALAMQQRCAVIIRLRDGGLHDIPIEHRAFDSVSCCHLCRSSPMPRSGLPSAS